jgi:hypothetical protein
MKTLFSLRRCRSLPVAAITAMIALVMTTGCGGGGSGGSSTSSGGGNTAVRPVINISLAKSQINTGESTTLNWSVTNASTCSANGSWSGAKALSGSTTVSQTVAGSYSYGLNCTGTGGSTNGSAVLTVVVASNALRITVDAGPGGASFNQPFASVTICIPGTSTCRTVDHVLIDTGSFGLRLISSAITPSLALPAVNNTTGLPVAECSQFVSGYTWGAVRRADVKLGGETASNLPVEIIGDTGAVYTHVPTACSNTGANFGTVASLGANGILGVGMGIQDCGSACSTGTAPHWYYACTSSSCTDTVMLLSSQVTNPVSELGTDNNGVMLSLSGVASGGATTLSGTLFFGIGTQPNNQLGTATVYAADNHGNFITTYKGTDYTESFIDSGSNGLFFADSAIPTCSASTDFYCPPSTLSLSATTASANKSVSGTVNFTIENLQSLSGNISAASVGGTVSNLAQGFDWGLPFFFGRKVFVAIAGASTPGGVGPYWAY